MLIMDDDVFSGDCTRCAALCCVMLAFDRSGDFASDKPAGVPCASLSRANRCTIHASREPRGFAGCARYDCTGAGQRVTEEVFRGSSWRDDPALVGPMMDAFRAMREVQELWLLLRTARTLPLSPAQRDLCDALERELDPERTFSPDALAAFERSPLAAKIRGFLTSLRDTASFSSAQSSSSRGR